MQVFIREKLKTQNLILRAVTVAKFNKTENATHFS